MQVVWRERVICRWERFCWNFSELNALYFDLFDIGVDDSVYILRFLGLEPLFFVKTVFFSLCHLLLWLFGPFDVSCFEGLFLQYFEPL